MLQGISLKKRVRERKRKRKTQGDQASSVSKAHNFIFKKGLLYLDLYIEGNERCKVIESAQTFQQFCPYRNQDFFCKPFP